MSRPSVWGNSWTTDDYHALFGGGTGAPARLWCANKFRNDWQGVLGSDNDLYDRLGVPYEMKLIDVIRERLAGHDLACWCPLDDACHADVLLELANA